MSAAELKLATDGNSEIDVLRARCREIMATEELSVRQLSNDSGIPYGTLSAWLGGTYAGRNDRVADLVSRWLTARAEWRSTSGSIATAPGYLSTPSAVTFAQALRVAQALPDITAIVGAPGIGKTMAIRRYQETNPNVVLVTANPSINGANTILAAIAGALRLTERDSKRLYQSIGNKLGGGQALIIVDEAQHLNLTAFEQLRALHDEYSIGLAFVGNPTIHSVLSGGKGGTEHAQLSSRFGFRVVQRRSEVDDIAMILDAWEIEGEAERKFLTTIAGKPGALRVMSKVIRLASMLTQGAGKPNVALLRTAYEQQTRNPGAAA